MCIYKWNIYRNCVIFKWIFHKGKLLTSQTFTNRITDIKHHYNEKYTKNEIITLKSVCENIFLRWTLIITHDAKSKMIWHSGGDMTPLYRVIYRDVHHRSGVRLQFVMMMRRVARGVVEMRNTDVFAPSSERQQQQQQVFTK